MLSRRAILSVPGLALLSAKTQAQTDWRQQIPEVRYGMISVENERDAIARLQGLQAFMARELRTSFRVFRGSDYAAVVEAMRVQPAGTGEVESCCIKFCKCALRLRPSSPPIRRKLVNSAWASAGAAAVV